MLPIEQLAAGFSADTPRLNLGCGRNPLAGWINLDRVAGPGIDIVADLERCREQPLPLAESSIGGFLLSHVIEHIADTLGLMAELHRIARPGAMAAIHVPYGASDDAWEDPTHVRPYFLGSWGYFSQPYYWRADYGYRGDWAPQRVHLVVDEASCSGLPPDQVLRRIHGERNIVKEMIAFLTAVKPIRAPLRELQVAPRITVQPA